MPGPSSTYHPTYGPLRKSALVSVKVPTDAKVFVNDRATTSIGTDRDYISRDLQAGASYNYDVRAEFMRDGKLVTEIKSVQLIAGQVGNLDFTQVGEVAEARVSEPARTTLTVHVPADAKLYLSGHETKATGPVREFSTTKLANGSEWTTYAIAAPSNAMASNWFASKRSRSPPVNRVSSALTSTATIAAQLPRPPRGRLTFSNL